MMSWRVTDENTGREHGQHKTKKAATEQAADMQNAHELIDSLHEGQPWKFVVEKVEDPTPPEAD